MMPIVIDSELPLAHRWFDCSSYLDFIFGQLGRRKKFQYILLMLIFSGCVWWLLHDTRRVSNEPSLEHFRRSRNLSHYMSNISLITEPSSTPCDSLHDVPLLVLVASTPARFDRRNTIRATWGPHFPTYFLLGLNDRGGDLTNVLLEAGQNNDLIVYDFQEHYQNLTLKTALMLRWTADRCSSVGFLMKTDDDILVNPWIMSNVMKKNSNAKLIGYKQYNVWPYRDEFDKWYLPRWLFQQDYVPEYLLGAAYLINGNYIKMILDAATEVPLINVEDIHFTYLVARSKLGLDLTHDPRLSPYSHWFLIPCVYWPFAISHDLSSEDAVKLWQGFVEIAADYKKNKNVCSFFKYL